MTPTQEAIIILGMALVTFAVRYPVLALVGRMSLPEPVLRALKYVPPAVLTAIVVPAVLLPEGELAVRLDNAYLIGAIVAVIIAWRTRSLLWTILIGMAIFLAYLVPPSILFIPLATMVFTYGLFDTKWALILTYPTFLIPFCTWLLMGYFRSIPYELEECALIDGASRLQILVKILLPLAVPGLISAGIFAFTLSWNEFIYALTFISSSENKTVPVGVITELVEGDVYHWGSLMAGALLGSLPVAILYSFFVEHYVSSMTGAVKE